MVSLLYADWEQLEIRDTPVPQISESEVLLRVSACGICGSELETFKNRSTRRTPPLIMGHEFCGTVVDSRSNGHFQKGQRVISHSIVTCGACDSCDRGDQHLCAQRQVFGMHRQGAFAEFVNVPGSSLIPWPDNLPAGSACLAEPLANGVHVANRLKSHNPRLVVILGAGPIGLMCQQAVQVLLGAETIVVDMVPERLDAATALGARTVVNARNGELHRHLREGTRAGADAVVDAVGSATTKQESFRIVRPGGAVVWIGLHENQATIDSYEITLSEKTVYGSYAASLEELRQSVDLMGSGRVDTTSWVQTFPIGQGVEAFHRMLQQQGNDIKGVITM